MLLPHVVDVFSRRWFPCVFPPPARSEGAVRSVLAAVKGLAPDQIRGIRLRCDNGAQYASRESRKAMGVPGVRIEHVWASMPQQNGHAGSFHNTLKRDYVRTHNFESFQGAEAWLPRAHKDCNANRACSSLGRVPPDEYLRLWERNNSEGAGLDDDGGDRGLEPPPPQKWPQIVLNSWGPDHVTEAPASRKVSRGM